MPNQTIDTPVAELVAALSLIVSAHAIRADDAAVEDLSDVSS